MFFSRKQSSIRKQLKVLRQTRKFLQAHLSEWEKRKSDLAPEVFDSVYFLLESSVDAYNSIESLYKHGHVHSCIMLARTILENAVNLKYILQEDTERRAKNFMLFPLQNWLDRSKYYEHCDKPEKEELIVKVKEKLEEYKPSSNRHKNHWDGKSVKEMFEDTKLGQFYVEGYMRLSGFVHPMYKENIDIHSDRLYFSFIRRFIFTDILVVTCDALKKLNEKYDLLEGGVVIQNYPDDNSDFFFSVNNKSYEK